MDCRVEWTNYEMFGTHWLLARLLLVTLQYHNPNSTTTPQSICRDRHSEIFITLLHCSVTVFGEIYFHKDSGYCIRTKTVTFSMYCTLTCSTYAHTSLQYMFLLWYYHGNNRYIYLEYNSLGTCASLA